LRDVHVVGEGQQGSDGIWCRVKSAVKGLRVLKSGMNVRILQSSLTRRDLQSRALEEP
jgi:hypothetical protein